MGQVYAVASGKGGVGKTTTAINLSVGIRRRDHTVALVDADLGMANLGPLLDIENDVTLHDVLAGDASIEEAVVEEADGFAVVPGRRELSGFAAADLRQLGDAVERLADQYDYVLLDTGAGLSHEDLLPLGLADEIILVTSPDVAAIGDTRKTKEFASMLGKSVQGVVVTKTGPDDDAEDIARDLETALLGAIPTDPAVPESTRAAKPLEAQAPDSAAAEAYRSLAATITGEATDSETQTVADSGVDGGTPAASDAADRTSDSDSGDESGQASQANEETTHTGDESGTGTDAAEGTAGASDDGVEPAAADKEHSAPEEDSDGESGGLFSRVGRLFR